MKKLVAFAIVAGMLELIACSPNKKELEAKEKAKQDSIMVRQKADSLAAVEKEEAKQDSILTIGKSLMDWDKLSLNIVKVYTLPQIKSSQESLTPKAGFQLVILDIKANIPKAMDIILNPKDFIARTETSKATACAIGIEGKDEMIWGISGAIDGGGIVVSPEMKWHENEAGDIIFSVGFLIPSESKNFQFICRKAVMEAKLI